MDFLAGEVLLIDKPLEWTSFQVVAKLRYELKYKLGIKKIKVGHAGTLDPLATGLLIICTGKKTKEIEGFQGQAKEYTGTIQLGSTTPSFDLETEIDYTFPTGHINESSVKEAAERLTGFLDQVPPSFSAKKVNGVRAYSEARKGNMLQLKPKTIEVTNFDTQLLEHHAVKFKIGCSKGTYIRSLARDLGKELNSGGHLTELRRTKIGDFDVENAVSIDQMIEIIKAV